MSDETNTGDSPRETDDQRKKRITPRERHFAKLIAETGMGSVEAARVALGWRCEPNSPENQKARDLARAPRIKDLIDQIKGQGVKEQQAKIDLKLEFGDLHKGKLRDYAFKHLQTIRDDPQSKAAVRYTAIKLLKKLHDPGKDINLIWRWIDTAWRYQTAHCPCCHASFPMESLKNEPLDKWRKDTDAPEVKTFLPDKFAQQMELIKMADKRRTPHAGQILALSAPERHIIGLGAARAGKSYLLAIFAILAFCLPGVEIWILGETYDRTVSEVDYIQKFLNAIFYPHYESLVKVNHDKKTGEMVMTSKWGSILKVKSAKAKGSITARALELALAAEPGWLPADIYEELRARMSERLGRIIALGTPKGIGAFVGRMTNMTGRDPKTGKIIRWKPEDRLIKNGAVWSISLLKLNLSPEDNPEYVKSELSAARMELTDEEYASEFEGIGMAAEGMKFSAVKQYHLRRVDPMFFERAVYVLGIDQGPKNFGVCLVAFDGHTVVPCWEYFNSDTTTMKRNLIRLRAAVPKWIGALGGNPSHWLLTVTDIDPPLYGAFEELDEEGLMWPTEITTRHRNVARSEDNWRRENQEFVNNIARKDRLLFHLRDDTMIADDESPGGYAIHDQVMQTVDKPDDAGKENRAGSDKGWQIADPWRGDHVLDAWYFCMWAIFVQELRIPDAIGKGDFDRSDPWASQKAAFNYNISKIEQDELRGHVTKRDPSELFEDHFGHKGPSSPLYVRGNYQDES